MLGVKSSFLVITLSGVACFGVYENIGAEEHQPELWELASYRGSDDVYALKHLYTGEVLDPLSIYVQKDRDGQPTGWRWRSDSLREEHGSVKAWNCMLDDAGIPKLTHTFTGESLYPSITADIESEGIYCLFEHEEDGLISTQLIEGTIEEPSAQQG